MYRVVFNILILIIPYSLFAQDSDVNPKSVFLSDSIKIGKPIGFAVTVEYPSEIDLIFPDSTSNYGNMEYHAKEWFPTNTRDGISKDSIIYYLKTFEIDSTQYFSLKFFQLNNGDSLPHNSPLDSFNLIHTVRSTPDSLGAIFLQEDTQYYRIPKQFNYPFLIAFVVVLAVLGVTFWLLFGTGIRKFYRIRRLKKENEKFLEKYEVLLDGLYEEQLPVLSENILVHWKKYMEKLESIPYRKLTTKELSEMVSHESLINSLREMDHAIYAKAEMDNVKSTLKDLEEISQEKFKMKLEELEHGGNG